MLPRSKTFNYEPGLLEQKPARRINISNLKGEGRVAMRDKIQAEQPALLEDLTDGGSARIREAFGDIGVAVIVSLDKNDRIITGKSADGKTPEKTIP